MLLKNSNNLKQILKADNVLTKLEERYCYANDACNLEQSLKIPESVVFVETIEDVQNVIKFANAHNIPIVSRGAGTNMVGACVCNNGGIVLNFSKMNKIIEINPLDMFVKVQPGVVLGDLKKEVEKFNLFFPPDPSNYRVSTVGGAIAQSSGGAMALKYGTTKDYVLSLKVVTADGSVMTIGTNTTKESVGYHLAQLIVGSEGTLAVIVEATLKLIPKPTARKAISAYFNSSEEMTLAVNQILASNILPTAIDFMDNNSIKTVNDFAKCGLKSEFQYLLIIDLDGSEALVNENLALIQNILRTKDSFCIEIAENNKEAELIWKARRSSYAASTRLAPDVVSDDLIVPRSNIAKLLDSITEITNKYNLQVCLVGHIGDGNMHPQFVLDLEDEVQFRNYKKAKDEIYRVVINLGGTISAEHGVGLEKKDYLKYCVDAKSLEYMKIIKKIFDPKNILNPGKIFDI